ncbi:BTAD domain-containing putative transcriptional regulator [Streptomyces sp. NPDC086091]|uniref:AfsR/SARP family transcriptional regulator n=1 Tax=Streptomyces sp. NPDC086091 TaxID=3365751 RepID=UPI00382E4FB2
MSETSVRFAVLGQVRAWQGSVEIGLGTPQQRVVMTALLLRRSSTVSADDLVDVVWGDRPPRSALNQLHIYVHRLRRAIEVAGPGAPLITSVGRGYRLRLPDESLDLAVFQEKTAEAHRLHHSAPRRAEQLLHEALGLWQGRALADLPGEWAAAQRTRLEQARVTALESVYRIALDTGRHHDIAAHIADTVAEHPLDERFRELLMLALYRSGQQAAALDVFTRTRVLLAEELGIDPGARLQSLYQRILRADDQLLAPGPPDSTRTDGTTRQATPATPVTGTAPSTAEDPYRVPAQLPYDLPVFSGRQRELTEVVEVAEAARRSGSTALLCVAAGAGIGKTTFAIHAAHSLALHYPDGQVFLDLRGFDPHERPVLPHRALRMVLEAFGVPAAQIPDDVDSQTGLYRSILADKRILLLLDNVRDAQHVRPLLPPSPGSLVIVTSRDQMAGLVIRDGAHYLLLEPLPPADARDLLIRRLGAACVDADPAATSVIGERSSGLPLALALIAASAATRRVTSLTGIADELEGKPTALDALSTSDASTDIRSVFSWSYATLTPGAARLYRLSSLAPSAGCSVTALAALAGQPVATTRVQIDELIAAHLLEECALDRFLSHDLLREYAGELLRARDSEPERDEAFRRLLAHCLHTAYTAAHVLSRNLPPLELHQEATKAPTADVTTAEQAQGWFAEEVSSLRQLVERAGVVEGCETQTWQLAWSMMDHLQREGRWEDQIAVHRVALAAATRGEDLVGRAHVLRNLARSFTQIGRQDAARQHLVDALALFEDLGDPDGQARSHGNLALILTRKGENQAALTHVRRAVELFEAAGDPAAQASALNNLGWMCAQTGAYDEALRHCREALRLLHELDDLVARAATWDSIGYIQHQLGDYAEAQECYRRALDLDRQVGDEYNAAETLTHLGETRLTVGDVDGAFSAWSAALSTFELLAPQNAARLRSRLAALGEPADAPPERDSR